MKLRMTQEEWDEHFRFAIEQNISVRPLINTYPFLEENRRLIQMQIPNWIIWVFFRIEPDDENCTLLWLEAQGDPQDQLVGFRFAFGGVAGGFVASAAPIASSKGRSILSASLRSGGFRCLLFESPGSARH